MRLAWGDHQHEVTDLEFVTGARRNHFRWTKRLVDVSGGMRLRKRSSLFRRIVRRIGGTETDRTRKKHGG